MELRVLGMFEVNRGGAVVTPSAPKLRQVLALLSTRANSPVHTRQLVDELWEDRPPASWATTLQTYIYQLRKLLALGEQGQPAALHTRPSGYLLSLPPGTLDLHRFERLAAQGTAEMRGGHFEAAADTLRAALELWRGPALSDVTLGPILQADVVRLEECRNGVLEMRLDADLALGRYQQLISELAGLSAGNPTHEGLHGRLMLALYRAGRRSDALQVFQRVRAALAEDLGLEPGPELQRIHRAVLSSDPATDAFGAAAAPVPASGPAAARPVDPPAQLPPDVVVVGREAELARLERLLVERPDAAAAVSVVGAPGVGTSTFCIRAGHRIRAAFPDGQLFATMSATNGPGEILAGFLHAAGLPSSAIPADLDGRSALFRTWTANRKVLVILDDVPGTSQLTPLLPSGPGCATILASHRRLCDPTISGVVELAPLSTEHSLELLMSVAGTDRVQRDLTAAHALVQACAGLPLALRAAATKLALRPHWRVSHLADRVAIESRRLRELSTGSLDVTASVRRRYQLLPVAHREPLRRIVAHARRPVTAAEVAVLLSIEEPEAETVLEHLVELQLATVESDEVSLDFRYWIHPLVRLAIPELDRATGNGPRGVTAASAHGGRHAGVAHPAASVPQKTAVPV
jgi:DNA-binding SARP family transcriptional activator